MAENYEILFQKVVKEIKSFIVLMHDAVIRFYKLEVKVGLQCSQNEHLTNLLTSLVLKNPIYSDVHGLIRHHLKPTIKKIQKTIYAIRTKFKPLEETLKVNPYLIGRNILKFKQEE